MVGRLRGRPDPADRHVVTGPAAAALGRAMLDEAIGPEVTDQALNRRNDT